MSKSDSSTGASDEVSIKKARDTLAVILKNMDRDLQVHVVLAAMSFKYQKVVEVAATCSDLMYLREMLASIEKLESPTQKNVHGYTQAEVREHLLKFGYVL